MREYRKTNRWQCRPATLEAQRKTAHKVTMLVRRRCVQKCKTNKQ